MSEQNVDRDAYASRNTKPGRGFRVSAEQCASCIFGPNSAIAGRPARMRDLARQWAKRDCHQVCHAFGSGDDDELDGEDVACRGWWDTQTSQNARIAERLGCVSFEPLPKGEPA